MICTAHQIFFRDKIEKNEMGGACSADGERTAVYRVLMGNPSEREHCGDRGLDAMIILRWIFQEVGCVSMEWIDLAEDSDRRRALVNTVMKLRVPKNMGFFLTSCKPVSFSRRTLHHGV
jgi:hypothetical protein